MDLRVEARRLPSTHDQGRRRGGRASRSRAPSFNALQNGSAGAAIFFYLFDVIVLGGRNVIGETVATRRDMFLREVLPLPVDPELEAPRFDSCSITSQTNQARSNDCESRYEEIGRDTRPASTLEKSPRISSRELDSAKAQIRFA